MSGLLKSPWLCRCLRRLRRSLTRRSPITWLAELDAGGPDPNEALPQIDAARALAQETGDRLSDSMLHRIRGEMLLKRDPANPGPAKEAANRHRRRETVLNAAASKCAQRYRSPRSASVSRKRITRAQSWHG
jgi:hypothetical protein